jgi:hypothetical protein
MTEETIYVIMCHRPGRSFAWEAHTDRYEAVGRKNVLTEQNPEPYFEVIKTKLVLDKPE